MATAALSQQPARAQGGGVASYKDLSSSSMNQEKELKGTDKFAPASYPHYLPVWDNEKGVK